MAFSYGDMIAYASRGTEVRPGDVLGSGTCGGGCLAELWGREGFDAHPPLRPGDLVTVTVEQLGTIPTRWLVVVDLFDLRAEGDGDRIATCRSRRGFAQDGSMGVIEPRARSTRTPRVQAAALPEAIGDELHALRQLCVIEADGDHQGREAQQVDRDDQSVGVPERVGVVGAAEVEADGMDRLRRDRAQDQVVAWRRTRDQAAAMACLLARAST